MTDKSSRFKEAIDNIPVPVDKLDAVIAKTGQAEQGSTQKRKQSIGKKVILSVGALVATFALIIGLATVSPVMASIVSHIPVLGSVFSESDDRGLRQVSELGLTQVVGESKTIEGNTVTIDEVFYDGTRLTVGYSLTSEKPLGEFYLEEMNVTIDGKNFSWIGNGGDTEMTPTYRTGIYHIEPSDIDVPDQFKLGLSFEGKSGEKWMFSVPVKTQSDAKIVTINQTQQAGSVGLNISNLEISPVGLRITYSTVVEENELPTGAYIKFKAVDSSGNELGVSSEGGGHGEIVNGKVYAKGNSLFEPINEHVTELTITPYLDLPLVEKGVSSDDTPVDSEPYTEGDVTFESFTVTLP